MTDSLMVGGYELIGAATNPEYRLAPDWDFGEGEPDTVTISSQFLDGDAVVGDRTSNRAVKLPVMVFGSSRLDLSTKIDLLRRALAVKSWTGQWTPDTGLPGLLDCYRAKVVRKRDCVRDAMLSADVEITFPALPFMRSPDQKSITVAARSQVDSFDTAPTTGATLDTTAKIEGTGSAKVTGNRVGTTSTYTPSAPISRSITSHDYSTFANFTVQWATTGSTNGTYTVTLTLTLTSASGSTTYPAVQASVNIFNGLRVFQIASIPLSGGVVTAGTGVTLTAVTSYSLASSEVVPTSSPMPSTANWWIDDMEATGSSAALTSTTRGTLLLVPNVIGSARTPVSIAAVASMGVLLAHRPPNCQDPNLQILTGVTIAASPSTPAASTIATPQANFNGTYSVVLGVSGNGAAGPNTVAVTITQLENGVARASTVLTATYTSPQPDALVKLGEVTLPLRAIPGDNTTTTYTIAPNHSIGADTYSDFILLDTRGQTVIADAPGTVGALYVDEPQPTVTLGNVYASAGGNRTDTFGILDACLISGGPFVFDPGNNRMLVWADTTAPALTATFYPRWLDERVA